MNRYGKLAVAALALVAAGCGGGNDTPSSQGASSTTPSIGPLPAGTSSWTAVGGFANPESVAAEGDRRFVSNVGAKLEPTAKDGDGFVSELDVAGGMVAKRAFPRAGDAPLHAPKGMGVTGNKLYVADIDRVVGYDLASKAQVFEAPLGANGLLNDIAVLDSKTLLVTETTAGKVYKLDLESKKFDTLAEGMPGANGVALDKSGKTAYVAAIGAKFEGGDLFKLDVTRAPATPQKVGSVHGMLDGVAVLDSGNIVVSDWVALDKPEPGTIKVYNPEGKEEGKIFIPGDLRGPADFHYDAAKKETWVPSMPDGNVVIVSQ